MVVLGGGLFLMSEVPILVLLHAFPGVDPSEMSLARGTSLIRNSAPLGPYSRTMPRALWWP